MKETSNRKRERGREKEREREIRRERDRQRELREKLRQLYVSVCVFEKYVHIARVKTMS